MLLRNRAPGIGVDTPVAASGYDHIESSSIAVLRWLSLARIDFVLVGAVARAARGDRAAHGPVDIVPAPYGRNLDRLADALGSVRAHERLSVSVAAASTLTSSVAHPPRPLSSSPAQLRVTAAMLVRLERWELRMGEHEIDIEGRPAGAPSYQELLYEAVRFTLAAGATVEVAAPEDIEYYEHVRRTGVGPEMTVARL